MHVNFFKHIKLRVSKFSCLIRIISILSICPHELWSFCKDTREWCHCSSMCSTGRSFLIRFIIKRLVRPSTRTYVRKHECPFATVNEKEWEKEWEKEKGTICIKGTAHAHRFIQILLVTLTTCKSRIRDTKDPSSRVYDRAVKVSPKGFTIKAGSFQDTLKWIKRAWFFKFGNRFSAACVCENVSFREYEYECKMSDRSIYYWLTREAVKLWVNDRSSRWECICKNIVNKLSFSKINIRSNRYNQKRYIKTRSTCKL